MRNDTVCMHRVCQREKLVIVWIATRCDCDYPCYETTVLSDLFNRGKPFPRAEVLVKLLVEQF